MSSLELLALIAILLMFWCIMAGIVTVTYQLSISGDTVSTTENSTITGGTSIKANPNLPKAYSGTLTTRTSGTAGVITATGHNVIVGQRVDVYWEVGGVQGWAYGGIVSAIGATTVTFAGLAGTALPVVDSAVTIAKAVVDVFECDGDEIQAVTAYNNANDGIVVFASDAANLYAVLVEPGIPFHWKAGDDGANPLAGMDIKKVWQSTSKTSSTDTAQKVHAVLDITGTGSA